ncbi:uncharacterized protein LOC6590070 [Drosophila persimilis]|uniref:Regulatory protein zeste n=1 Tax=Drosophila pseudoobscura pseudoobscura TaxID=46245 RepID=A0A6I8UTH5_DROPS|nr:uncharacterized protein LOC4804063 [Drosophila pseudoobscura]XP_026841896.1 uncharacterized protein LOC6590070 [Drosophila persimilis]
MLGKMDRRKKRTSSEQYQMYIDMMEADSIFATGRVPRDYDLNYLTKKWKELSDRLNKCSSGPTLTAEEWRKRLNDWKNTTRCKYRRSLMATEKDISMTTLENRALDLFGKVPSTTGETLLNLKSEKDDGDDEIEEIGQRTSAAFQKELQAAVEEAINDEVDDVDDMLEEHVEQEDIIDDNLADNSGAMESSSAATTAVNTGGGTYRTIVVDNTSFEHVEDPHPVEFVTARRTPASSNSSVHAVINSGPVVETKLINGELPVKRLRTQTRPDQIIYHVKNAPRCISNIQDVPPLLSTKVERDTTTLSAALSSQDGQQIAHQLKRLADINYETLQFEIARFKFNNPGFQYNPPSL